MADPEFTTEELESEEWRPCVSFSGYEVSSLGRVRSLRFGRKYGRSVIIMRPRICKGYYVVELSAGNAGKRRSIAIHILVARAFVGPRPEGRQVNHKNGQRFNNRATNLEYLTPQQNLRHAQEIGLVQPMRINEPRAPRPRACNLPVLSGEDSPAAKLTADDVRDIRRLRAGGASYAELATRFGIAKDYVPSIVRRRTWSHIE